MRAISLDRVPDAPEPVVIEPVVKEPQCIGCGVMLSEEFKERPLCWQCNAKLTQVLAPPIQTQYVYTASTGYWNPYIVYTPNYSTSNPPPSVTLTVTGTLTPESTGSMGVLTNVQET